MLSASSLCAPRTRSARLAVVAALCIALSSSAPAFARSGLAASNATPEALAAAAALELGLEKKGKISSKAPKSLLTVDAPKGGYAAAAASAPAPDAGAPFSLPSFPFALPFFGAPAPAPSSAAAAAAPKAAEKEVSPLLPAVLLLFSPLLLVQAVSLQTAARVLPAVAGKVAEQAVALVAGEPEPATKKK